MKNDIHTIIEKEGKQVLIGHYYRHPSGDLISDPVLAFDYNKGNWFPVRIEQTLGDVTCSFIENGKRMIYPERIKDGWKTERWLKMFKKQEVLAQKIETCAFCGQEFDVNKRDNSGYIDNKPICAPCREDYGDYL